ncbi:hypothetical protein AQPE_0336 [Aquipluma nitroreducens]|uniref:Uncharacterized protein n=1 Tax=Aquipluma nitroreducens TaxID=2010828 RepID=A0A5K7S3W9_9BACT|nr:hypothetical protein AQPE_0336 [Aquipluma nitroreducens]
MTPISYTLYNFVVQYCAKKILVKWKGRGQNMDGVNRIDNP